MKKLLILANSSIGLYKFRNEMVVKLLQQFKVYISVPDSEYDRELEQEGCEITHVQINRRGTNPFQDLKLTYAYNNLLKTIKPDMVLTYTVKPNIYGGYVCRRNKIPYIATITGLGTAFQEKNLLKKLIIKMYQVSLSRSECIFFQNSYNERIFTEYKIFGKRHVLVNGSGVNLQVFPTQAYSSHEKNILLFVGRIMKEKGIEEFISAAEALKSEHNVFQILGYCDEDYEERLRELEQRGIIEYKGFQTDMHPFYKEASAIVLPTYHEGMSNVLMEAAATARPVIATNISGCKEIVEDGVTGFLCEPKDAAGLQEALKKFLALPTEERARMGLRGREKMEREFDRNLITDVYIKEIEKAIK